MDAIIDQIASEMDSLNIHEAAASLASNTNANSVSMDDLGIYLYWQLVIWSIQITVLIIFIHLIEELIFILFYSLESAFSNLGFGEKSVHALSDLQHVYSFLSIILWTIAMIFCNRLQIKLVIQMKTIESTMIYPLWAMIPLICLPWPISVKKSSQARKLKRKRLLWIHYWNKYALAKIISNE